MAADLAGPVLVAVTTFQADRVRDLPGIYRSGLALRQAWAWLDGAVGMWLWTEPLRRRSGSVSVWRDEQALRQFVAWPDHVTIMQRYRRRGRVTSTMWPADRCQPPDIWAKARSHLSGRQLPLRVPTKPGESPGTAARCVAS